MSNEIEDNGESELIPITTTKEKVISAHNNAIDECCKTLKEWLIGDAAVENIILKLNSLKK